MIEIKDLEQIIDGFLEQHEGYFLVHLGVSGDNRIEVVVDHDTLPVDIDTIVALSRHIEGALDRDVEDFELEVSSAGLTSPLVGERRYRKFIGKELEVLLRSGVKEVGILSAVSSEEIELKVVRKEKPEGERRKREVTRVLSIPYEEVKRATYLLRV